jgi:hypothetical protein
MLHRVVWYILTDVSEELTASTIRAVVEAVNSSETSISISHTALRNIPEVRHLYIRRRVNLKSYECSELLPGVSY